MPFVSTRGGGAPVSLHTAVVEGLAPDGGLFVPAAIEPLPPARVAALRGAALAEIGTTIASHLTGDEIPIAAWRTLLADALDFEIPLVRVHDDVWALELFHGPTLAFKDVGARTLARLLGYFQTTRVRRGGASAPPIERASADDVSTVLVATSGDTGGAVAHAFHGVPGTRVIVLYPDGQVSRVQEAQFATLGGNVRALAVSGTFDDCQRLVKEAFSDGELRRRWRLTSANSINVGRLLPQIFYYAQASLAQDAAPIFSVPSGNFGNLTAGLFAQRLGFPIAGFVAATNINDTIPRFLASGRYDARPSRVTVANAMDVGDPSNFERIRWLFDDDLSRMRRAMTPSVHTDDDVRTAIATLLTAHGYLCDPHGAIAYLGLQAAGAAAAGPRIFLATAHPAKFGEVVEPVIGAPVPLPPALAGAVERPLHPTRIQARLADVITHLDAPAKRI